MSHPMKSSVSLSCLLALAAVLLRADGPSTLGDDTRFLRSALAFCRSEAEKAGARCREPDISLTGPAPWRDSWTGLSVVLDLPLPDEPGKLVSARLSVVFAGTNAFDLGWFDPEIAFHRKWHLAQRYPNGMTDYTNTIGMVLTRAEMNRHPYRILHYGAKDRSLVLRIPVKRDVPGLWDDFWKSATQTFEKANWAPDLSGPPEPGDEEAWGVDFFPAALSQTAGTGVERVAYCTFDSREPFHDSDSLLTFAPHRFSGSTPGWVTRLFVRRGETGGTPQVGSSILFASKEAGWILDLESGLQKEWKPGQKIDP